eukprot:gene5620-11343_t
MEFRSAVLDAVARGDEEAVKYLLRVGASINMPDDEGKTALHWTACSSDGERIIPFLIQNGSQINASDRKGRTALHLHCMSGNVYGVSCLLFHGADVNMRTYGTRRTALQIASSKQYEEIATLLLAHGAAPSDIAGFNSNFYLKFYISSVCKHGGYRCTLDSCASGWGFNNQNIYDFHIKFILYYNWYLATEYASFLVKSLNMFFTIELIKCSSVVLLADSYIVYDISVLMLGRIIGLSTWFGLESAESCKALREVKGLPLVQFDDLVDAERGAVDNVVREREDGAVNDETSPMLRISYLTLEPIDLPLIDPEYCSRHCIIEAYLILGYLLIKKVVPSFIFTGYFSKTTLAASVMAFKERSGVSHKKRYDSHGFRNLEDPYDGTQYTVNSATLILTLSASLITVSAIQPDTPKLPYSHSLACINDSILDNSLNPMNARPMIITTKFEGLSMHYSMEKDFHEAAEAVRFHSCKKYEPFLLQLREFYTVAVGPDSLPIVLSKLHILYIINLFTEDILSIFTLIETRDMKFGILQFHLNESITDRCQLYDTFVQYVGIGTPLWSTNYSSYTYALYIAVFTKEFVFLLNFYANDDNLLQFQVYYSTCSSHDSFYREDVLSSYSIDVFRATLVKTMDKYMVSTTIVMALVTL